ncbi:hypothetical protein LUZ60_009452 [Juncus effusus]|nr:hypothetical protein LUZ60_009452 [Juncus effusus]
MKPIFCGNLDYDTRQSEVERLFRRYGRVEKIDIKSGFAFVYMEDERDADDAIRALDRTEFGRKGRRLRVEWTKDERGGGGRRSGSSRRSPGSVKPAKTLFVINFDPVNTRVRDLERHFDPYGKIVNVRIRKNFAFVQYENLDDAIKAFEATNSSKLLDRVITVEYAIRDDEERRNGNQSPNRRDDRDRDRYRGRERSRSPDRYRRERASPDYGTKNNGRDENPKSRRSLSPKTDRSKSPKRSRRSASPRKSRRSESPRKNRRSESPKDFRRDGSPKKERRSESPRDYRRDESAKKERRSESPKKERRSESPKNGGRSQSPKKERRSESPKGYRRDESPKKGRRSESPKTRVSESPKRGRDESPENGHAMDHSMPPSPVEKA